MNIGGGGAACCSSGGGGGSSEVRHEVGRVAGRQTRGNGKGGCTSRGSADENASVGVIALARVGDTLANRRGSGDRSRGRSKAVLVGGLAVGGEFTFGTGGLAGIGEERNTGSC